MTARHGAPRAFAGLKPGRRRIGLLGGSFNPAHEGHLYISRQALARLSLGRVWWLVSPQNPLKPAAGMAALAERLASARAVSAGERRIRVTDLEARLGSSFTAETLVALAERFPRARFVWLMGADNLIQISRWQNWTAIFEAVPVAVFARPTYSNKALASKAARRFAAARVAERQATQLADRAPPAWAFLYVRPMPISSTAIRAARGAAPDRASARRSDVE